MKSNRIKFDTMRPLRLVLVLLLPAMLLLPRIATAYTERIGPGDTVVAKLCPLHHIHLRPGTAHVAYAASIDSLPYFAASRRYFPYANEAVYGGPAGKATSAKVYYCPACREAFENWRKQREEYYHALQQKQQWLQLQRNRARRH